jgi:hypothetical protein
LQIIDNSNIMKRIHPLSQRNRTLLILAVFIAFGFNAAAQYKENTEIGVLGGVSYYLGDLNTTHFFQPSPAAGLVIRKNIDERFSYKAEALYLTLQSDERDSEDIIAADRGLHFRSSVLELSGQLEFNFLPYESGNPLYTWTPFIYTGISIFHHNPQAENINGEWVNLQELGTEGQGTTLFSDRKEYSLIQFAIPMGGGVKIAVNKSFNIILEYGARKTFTDYLDDVSTTFVGGNGDPYPIEMTDEAIEMSDPISLLYPDLTHSKGDQRGSTNDKKDWYSFAGITLSFKLNNNTTGCDY